MDEFFRSIAEALKIRSTSSVLGSYFLFWSLFHWQVYYVTLFVSEDKIFDKFGMLKNEYINHYFLKFDTLTPAFALSYILPALLTYLYIWVLPELLFIKAYDEDSKYRKNKKVIRLINDTEIKAAESKYAKATADLIKSETKVAMAEEEKTKADPNYLNKQLYDEFMERKDALSVLKEIKECYYEYGGLMHGSQFDIDTDAFAVAHSHNLIKRDGAYLSLTDLGKYFISRL